MMAENTVNAHRVQNFVSEFYVSQEKSSLCNFALNTAFITPILAICSHEHSSQMVSVGDWMPYFYHTCF